MYGTKLCFGTGSQFDIPIESQILLFKKVGFLSLDDLKQMELSRVEAAMVKGKSSEQLTCFTRVGKQTCARCSD